MEKSLLSRSSTSHQIDKTRFISCHSSIGTLSKFCLSLLFFLCFTITGVFAQYDIEVDHTVDNPTASVGDVVEFTIVLSNLFGDDATNIQLTDSLSSCLLWDASNTLIPTSGGAAAIYDSGTHTITWDVASLSTANISDTLRFKATVDCEGVYFSKVEVTTPTGANDLDANPSNTDYGEDDIATACVSVPIWICVTSNDSIFLEAASTSDVQWYRVFDFNGNGNIESTDTVPHPSPGFSNTTYAVAEGEYFYTSSEDGCDAGLCCPIIVMEPDPIPCMITGVSEICQDALAETFTGPAGLSVYEWSVTGATINGATDQATVDIDFASTDAVLQLKLTNEFGCIDSCSIDIIVNPKPSCTIDVQDISCTGSTDGELTAMPTGGLADYSYLWSNGETTANITGLGVATYTVTITDFNGCTTECSAAITEPTALSCTLTQTAASCHMGADGTITVTGAGGTGTYEYSLDGGVFQPGNTFSNLSAGAYTVSIKDANGCLSSCPISILEPAIISCTPTKMDVSCLLYTSPSPRDRG